MRLFKLRKHIFLDKFDSIEDFHAKTDSTEKLYILDKKKEKECDIYFTFTAYTEENPGENILFIAYSDRSSFLGRKNIYCAKFIPSKKTIECVSDPKEVKMINDVLKEIIEEAKNEE